MVAMNRLTRIVRHVGPRRSRSDRLAPAPVADDAAHEGGGDGAGKIMPKLEVLRAFAADPLWADKPFWMLNVLKFKDASKYQEYADVMGKEVLPKIGARIVFGGAARTFVGKVEYDAVYIVEYPSPEAFMRLATTAPSSEEAGRTFQARREGLEEQYLIPMRPGWFHLERAAPSPTAPLHALPGDALVTTPSGLIRAAVPGARAGETSATDAQALGLVHDHRFDAGPIWNLNLLRFTDAEGKESFGKYSKAMGGKTGVLPRNGARSTLANDCYRSLIGDIDFDQAIIVEYPSRERFLSMCASKEYMETAHFRHQGLDETYLVACVPTRVVGATKAAA